MVNHSNTVGQHLRLQFSDFHNKQPFLCSPSLTGLWDWVSKCTTATQLSDLSKSLCNWSVWEKLHFTNWEGLNRIVVILSCSQKIFSILSEAGTLALHFLFYFMFYVSPENFPLLAIQHYFPGFEYLCPPFLSKLGFCIPCVRKTNNLTVTCHTWY